MSPGFLARIGNAVWVATIATLASFAVVTLVAAWSSAVRVIRENEPVGQTAQWYDSFRRSLPGTRRLSVVIVALAIVAAADIASAAFYDSGPTRYATLGIGGAIAVVLLAVLPHLLQQDFDVRAPLNARLRTAATLAGARPALTVALILGGAVTIAACLMIAPLTPLFLSFHLLFAARAHRAAHTFTHHRITARKDAR